MNIKILNILQANNTALQLVLSIDGQEAKYGFSVEVNSLGGQPVHGIQADDLRFSQMFRYNQRMTVQIYNLLQQVVEGSHPEFPIDLGSMVIPENIVLSDDCVNAGSK